MLALSAAKWLTIGCAVLALAAALAAMIAARMETRGSLDTDEEDERRIGRWNRIASTLNAASCTLLLLALAIENFVENSAP